MSDRKNNLLSYPIITAQNMTTSIVSKITNIQYLDNIGLQFTWSGAPVGTFSAEISADYAQDINGNVTNPGNWIPLTLDYFNGTIFVTTTQVPSSVGSPIYLDLDLLSAPWIRARYTAATGSGTLTAVITAKGL